MERTIDDLIAIIRAVDDSDTSKCGFDAVALLEHYRDTGIVDWDRAMNTTQIVVDTLFQV